MKLYHHILTAGLLTLGLALGLALGLTACDADLLKLTDDSKGSYKPSDGDPIATTLDNSGEFEEWVKVLNYTNTYQVLNALYDGQSVANKFTAFVPTNEAVLDFLAAQGAQSIEDLGVEKATYLVRTMVTSEDSIKLSEKFTTNSYYSVTNKMRDKLYFLPDTTASDPGFESGYLLNDSIHVSRSYETCSNGFYYVVDGIVMPMLQTVYDRVADDGKSTIMTQALQETGYAEILDTESDTTVWLGVREVTWYEYTFLNVTDSVFATNGINNLSDLKTALVNHAKDASVGADSLLKQYVEYHLFDVAMGSSSLYAMLSADDSVRIWNPLSPNQILMVHKHLFGITDSLLTTDKYGNPMMYVDTLSYYTFNDQDSSYQKGVTDSDLDPIYGLENRALYGTMSTYNQSARNGYVYYLDDWMPVYEPEPTTVVWDLLDYSQVRNLCGNPSRTYYTSENKVNVGNLECYTVEEGPNGTSNASYYPLTYVTCKSNLKNCVNYDRLVINVGYQGSVTMKTPTIVKGKYRVSLKLAYLTDQKFIRTSDGCKGGLVRMTVDGKDQILTAPYTSITKSLAGVYDTDLYDEIEFSETGTHTVKFVVMDPAASTNSKFYLQFDAITFTPIE